MCISVDLPEPEGPMTAVSCPRRDLERDAAERVDGGVALAVAPRRFRGRRPTARAAVEQEPLVAECDTAAFIMTPSVVVLGRPSR